MAISTDSAFVSVNVQYRILGLDEAARSTKKVSGQLAEFGRILKRVGQSLIAYKLVNKLMVAVDNLNRAVIDINTTFDLAEVQMRVFLGSSALAAREMEFLTFQSTRLAGGIKDLIKASTALSTFGLDTKQYLELVADTAQATGRPLEDIAIAFGRILANDRRWRQFIVTRRGDLAAFILALEQGETRADALAIAFGRFVGVSKELEGTLPRATEKIKDTAFVILKIISGGAFNKLKKFVADIATSLNALVFLEGKFRKDSEFVKFLVDVGILTERALPGLSKFEDEYSNFLSRLAAKDPILSALRIAITLTPYTPIKSIFSDKQRSDYLKAVLPFPTDESEVQAEIDELKNTIDKRLQLIASLRIQIENKFFSRAKRAPKGTVGIIWQDLLGKRQSFLKAEIRKRAQTVGAGIRESQEESLEGLKIFIERSDELFVAQQRRKDTFRELDLKSTKRFNAELIRLQEDAAREEVEVYRKKMDEFSVITDRVIDAGGFLIFGGVESNKNITKQIENLERELDIINGITAPLTRQEQLMNRIVELEGQRVNFTDRLGIVTRQILADFTKIVAKAVILNSINKGRGGFGFTDFLFKGLGIASIAGSGGASSVLGGVGAGFGAAPFAGNSNLPLTLGASKIVNVNNPVFLGSDMSQVVESADAVSARRNF